MSGQDAKDETPLGQEEFDGLWTTRDFKELVRPSATGKESLRYRRFVVEGRLAEAQYDMVRWTKFAVFAAIGTAMVSVLVTTFIALTRAGSCV